MVFLPHYPLPNKNAISNNSPEKLRPILAKLGNPQDKLPPTIHIAGTNGKGSTAAFLASIFQAANYKAHIYTSPHLHHCNERIVIANNQIDDGYLYEMLEEVRIAAGETTLTLFEGLTIAGILAFSKNSADVCIIETGMGGRVDATNVIDRKISTVLTSISLDHQEYLGNNLLAIACEKSYIMRSGVPCILAPQSSEALTAIENRSAEISNPLIYFGHDFKIEINEDETFNFENSSGIKFLNLSKPALQGWHQYLNASLAIQTICTISSFNISQKNINDGLKNVKWISRLEKLTHPLVKKEDELWIDGAHNQEGFKVLSDWIKEKIVDDFESQKPRRNYLIVGFTKNKAKPEFFYPFKDMIDFICAVRVKGEPNPEDEQVIVEKILTSKIDDVIAQDDLFDAINFLTNLDPQNPCRIIICGSLYLARDI